jgi:hypothetical protein
VRREDQGAIARETEHRPASKRIEGPRLPEGGLLPSDGLRGTIDRRGHEGKDAVEALALPVDRLSHRGHRRNATLVRCGLCIEPEAGRLEVEQRDPGDLLEGVGHGRSQVRTATGEYPRKGAKPGRVHTVGRRGQRGSASPHGLPRPGRSTHPWSSCTIGTAPRCWRCRTAHRQRRAARRDRRSGRSLGGPGARSPGTSRRARHARRGARGR